MAQKITKYSFKGEFVKIDLVLFCLLSLSSVGFASSNVLDVTGNSEFIATGKPGFIKIDGLGNGLSGRLELSGNLVSGQMSFPLNSLDTGVSLRDKHMKDEYLEVQKYPEAQLNILGVKLSSDPIKDGYTQKKVPFNGILTVHGVKHAVSGLIDLDTKSGVTKGDATFAIKISDFGFPEPKFMGMKVNDDVQLKIHIEAKKVKAG